MWLRPTKSFGFLILFLVFSFFPVIPAFHHFPINSILLLPSCLLPFPSLFSCISPSSLPHLSPFLIPPYISYLTPPFPLYQSPSPPPLLSRTCAPAEGEFRRRGNPRGSQAPHRWLANYTFITSPLLFLSSFGQRFTMTRCSCDTSHLSAADLSAHKNSAEKTTRLLLSCLPVTIFISTCNSV